MPSPWVPRRSGPPPGIRTHGLRAVVLAAMLPIGCRPSGGGAADIGAATQASGLPATQPAITLHDWPREPVVDEAERDPCTLRIVSAAPNVTEICCALGMRDCLVGRTRYCDYPPEIRGVRSIGALTDMSDEVLLELRPDLVMVSGSSRAVVERLRARGIRYESVPDASLDDLFEAIRRIGAIGGRPRTAQRLCDGIREELERVTRLHRPSAPSRVLLLTGVLGDPPRPPHVAGRGSFYDDLLRRAGHVNVVATDDHAFAPVSLEFILHADPDVIIELDPDGAQRPRGEQDARELWSRIGPLRAVAGGRIHVLRGGQHYLLGPRIAQTYHELTRLIAGTPP